MMRYLLCMYFIVFQLLLAIPSLAVDSPEACIREIGNSIIQADEKKFESLVDLDGIINDALDIFLRESGQDGTFELPHLLAIIFSQISNDVDGNKKLRNFLADETKAFIINGISSGAFAGRKPVSGGKGIFAPLFADVSAGKKEIRNVGKAKRVTNGWIVPFVIHDFGNDYNYDVNGFVNKDKQGMRLIAIENIKSLIVQVNKEYLQIKSGGVK